MLKVFSLDRFHIKLPLEISKPVVKDIEGGGDYSFSKNTTGYPYNGISLSMALFKRFSIFKRIKNI